MADSIRALWLRFISAALQWRYQRKRRRLGRALDRQRGITRDTSPGRAKAYR